MADVSELWAGDFPSLNDFFTAADQAEDRNDFIRMVRDNTTRHILAAAQKSFGKWVRGRIEELAAREGKTPEQLVQDINQHVGYL
jgi:hypothetical protein